MKVARFHGRVPCAHRLVSLSLVAAVGCTSLKATSSREETVPPREEPTTSSVSSGAAPTSQACASDEDCRTWSSYCAEAPCVCRVFAKTEAEPACTSTHTVTCFVDPCMKKAGACQGGRCVLVMAGDAVR
jgi:hypothetical protein